MKLSSAILLVTFVLLVTAMFASNLLLKKEFGKVMLPPFASNAVDICILYIIPAVLLVTAYIRLREKEF